MHADTAAPVASLENGGGTSRVSAIERAGRRSIYVRV